MKRVLKWSVPVDDHDHPIGAGLTLHVDCQVTGVVQVWTLEEGDGRPYRAVRVFGTGQPLPDDLGIHLGSVLDGPLVWHVFQTAGSQRDG